MNRREWEAHRDEWWDEMSQDERDFFERVRTGKQAEIEAEASRAHWTSLQEVHVCDVHGERPVKTKHCLECGFCELGGCDKPVTARQRYCSTAHKQAGFRRSRVTAESQDQLAS